MKKSLPHLFIFLLSACVIPVDSFAQAENVIIITTDGLRWQELFEGMDTAITNDRRFNEGDSSYIYKKYWAETPAQRRKKLLPFMWSVIEGKGSIYGNRTYGNKVDVANPHSFSYPGYSEIFTGNADSAINSNSFPPNPHINLLEFLNRQPKFKGKVAAFGAWNAFDRILNEGRSGIPVVNGFDTVAGRTTSQQKLLNNMLLASYKPWGNDECLDVFTHFMAMEYLKVNKPKVLYIAYGETDEWAHAGKYRSYLDAANQFDKWIQEIWNYVQSTRQYKNKTALFITTDHGRGDKIKEQWRDHGSKIEGASETWFAVIAPGIKPVKEVTSSNQYFIKQFAQTIANLLGVNFKPGHQTGAGVEL